MGEGLQVALSEPLPFSLEVGSGTAICLEGSCVCPGRRIRTLRVQVGDHEVRAIARGMPPPGSIAGRDWWWAVVPLRAEDAGGEVRVRLRARLAGGGAAEAELGRIRLDPAAGPAAGEQGRESSPDAPVGASGDRRERLVAICMATYDPPLDLLERQIESIRRQTHTDWLCVISDDCSPLEKWEAIERLVGEDPRFRLHRSPRRRGFYGNFERALHLVPPEATHVALADQDDRWHPEKLEALLGALRPGVTLAYSDARVVTAAGEVLSDTYWTTRSPGHADLGSLLIANTVSGAATLLPRELLDHALPFPPAVGESYHDRWLALVAASLGRIAYVDRPLYDYVQHPAATLGHAAANLGPRPPGESRLRMWRRRLARLRERRFQPGWRALYFSKLLRRTQEAEVLRLRVGDRLPRARARALARMSALERSPRAQAWLFGRAARTQLRGAEGSEGALLRAVAWRRIAWARARLLDVPARLRALRPRSPLELVGHLPASRRRAAALQRSLEAGAPSPSRRVGPTVTIAVLNRNGRHHLKRLIPALERTSYEPLELIVVDNGSTDGSVEHLRGVRTRFPLRVIENAANLSFSAANNQAVDASDGELVLLLNNDVEPATPDWLGHMVETLTERDAVAVGARLIYPRRSRLDNQGDLTFPDLTLQHRGAHFVADPDGIPRARHLGAGEDPVSPEATAVREVPAVTAACMLIRRAALEAVGSLDEGYRYGTEDADLCLRLREGGGRILYDGRAALYHHEYATQNLEGREVKRRNRAVNRRLFVDRWGPRIFREVLLDRLRGEGRWSQEPLHFGITLTRDDERAGAGDYYTAHELGEALEALGYRVSYLERHRGRWRDVDPSIDVVIALLDGFPLHEAPSHVASVAWVRNWTERWVEHPWFDDYDVVFASSARSQQIIESRSHQVAHLLPLATNPDRFHPTEPRPELATDVVFVGNHWGAERGLVPALADLGGDVQVKVFGKGWGSIPEVARLHDGRLPYGRLPAAYSSAGVVLDDTAGPTKPYHAVNGRVFDALACGAVVLSDNAEGVREVFDGEFPVWADGPSLRDQVRGLLDDPDRARRLAERYRRLVLERHTYCRRAEQIRDRLIAWCEARRFSIAVGVPRREDAEAWGDYHFARAMQKQLARRGHPAKVHLIPQWDEPATAREDVRIHLLGLTELRTRPGQLNVIWNISHPEKVEAKLLDRYDLAFVASAEFARALEGVTATPVRPLHQATDPERFHPEPGGAKLDLLFVGNSRKVRRRIIDDLTPTPHRLAIIGRDWTPDLVDPRHVAGEHVPNRDLHRYYSSAAIVLNDHWDGMRTHGFLSNRLYDALACGACVVSDDVEGIEAEFDGAVTTYSDAADLRERIEGLLRDPVRRRELGERGRRVVRERHTFERRMDEMLDPVLAALTSRRAGLLPAGGESATSGEALRNSPGAEPRPDLGRPPPGRRTPVAGLPHPVFVGGTGRSGTTVVAKLIARHSRYALIDSEVRFHVVPPGLPGLLTGSVGKRAFIRRLRGYWYDRVNDDGSTQGFRHLVSPRELEGALESFSARFRSDPTEAARRLMLDLFDPVAARQGKPAWVEMSPPNVSRARLLHALFPALRLVNVVRDGRDVACSVVPLAWGPDDVAEALLWWAEAVQAGDRAASGVPPDRVLTIRLEDLVRDRREETYGRLLEFLELPDEAAMRRWFEQDVTVERAHIGRWAADVEPGERAGFQALYEQVLARLAVEGVASGNRAPRTG